MAYKYIEPVERVYAKAYRICNNSTPASSYNIRALFPDVDYTALTNADFICGYNGNSGTVDTGYHQTGSGENSYYMSANGISISHSYNASNGILSISYNGYNTSSDISDGTRTWSGLCCDIVMIVDGIREDYT